MSRKVAKKPTKRSYAKRQVAAVSGRGAYYKRYKGYGAYHADKPRKGYGSRLGKTLGEGADILYDKFLSGGGLGKLLGFGDYVQAPWASDIKSNSLSMGLDPPMIQNSSMKNVIIRHREYLGDVITGAAGVFTNRAYSINPGVPETFPWLSQVATAFEQYKLRGCVFEFKSTSADALNSTNTALGTVIMATEYDVTRPDFASKQQMENHQYAMSARQSCSMLHPIECARSENVLTELYIRAGDDSGQDKRFCDFGDFQIATVGQQGNSVNIGELWVSYEIELLKPRFATSSGSGSVYSAHLKATTGITAIVPFGTNPVITGNLGLTVSVSGNMVQFPDWMSSGRFLVVLHCKGQQMSIVNPVINVIGCTLETIWDALGTTNCVYSPVTGYSSTTLNIMFVVDITAPSASLTFNGASATFPHLPEYTDLFVTSLNPLASVEEFAEFDDTPQALIDRLLESGKTVSELQKMISDKAFTPEKKEIKEEKKPATPSLDVDLSKSQSESIQALIDRVRAKRALDK